MTQHRIIPGQMWSPSGAGGPYCSYCGGSEADLAEAGELIMPCPRRASLLTWSESKEREYAGRERVIDERFTLPDAPYFGARRVSFTVYLDDYSPGEVWSLESDGRIIGWTGWGTWQRDLRHMPSRDEFEEAWRAAEPLDRSRRGQSGAVGSEAMAS